MKHSIQMLIMSALSDSQESIERGLYDQANRLINYAKFIAMNELPTSQEITSEALDALKERFIRNF